MTTESDYVGSETQRLIDDARSAAWKLTRKLMKCGRLNTR